MNAKERLNCLKNYEADVKTLNDELIALKSSVLKGQVLSHDPIRAKRGNKTEELNVSIINKSDQIYQKLEQLLDERTETVKAIDRLEDPLEKLVLRYFYIHGYSRERTARTLDRSASTISKIKSSAICNLEAILAPTDK